ncbi:hypothetical protein HJG60_008537 [Phyllostomus discolor]|uniref:Uncharacterized protein n=1 Tax=Phyllostomus discolor TaxID=89673 RepID=A0A833YSS8_9CHIR|nr:hypothetical protein HJG60_008537 [Phyllostomus discolor]
MTDTVQSRKEEEIENVTGEDSSNTGGPWGEVAGPFRGVFRGRTLSQLAGHGGPAWLSSALTGMWGCTDAGMQGCRVKGAGMQGCGDAGCRDEGVWGCRVQGCEDAGVQGAGVQGCGDARMQHALTGSHTNPTSWSHSLDHAASCTSHRPPSFFPSLTPGFIFVSRAASDTQVSLCQPLSFLVRWPQPFLFPRDRGPQGPQSPETLSNGPA